MDKEFLINLLDRRFCYRDFSILRRKWKLFHINQVANELLLAIRLDAEKLFREKEGKKNTS